MSSHPSSQTDPAMLELFQAEMDTHIPVLNERLLALEKGQAGAGDIEAMMRAAHSIKGAARIVGVEPAVRVSHVMEDCFTAAKDGRITLNSDAVDTLLKGVDALQRICSASDAQAVTEPVLKDLIDALGRLKSGQPAVGGTPPAPEATAGQAPKNLVAATVRREEPSVTLPAQFDEQACKSLRKELLDTLSLGPARIELDFGQVTDLSAGALALLASFAQEVGRATPAPILDTRGMRPAVRTVLGVAGLARIFGFTAV